MKEATLILITEKEVTPTKTNKATSQYGTLMKEMKFVKNSLMSKTKITNQSLRSIGQLDMMLTYQILF